MGNPLRQLAGETAIYGLSTILARIINFLFVPVYTRMLTTESYGVVTEFMAYIAVLQVVLVLGLETGCFRFANRQGVNPVKVYSDALAAVFGVSGVFLALMIAFAGPISSWLGYDGYGSCIMYVGGILASNPFCKTASGAQGFEICCVQDCQDYHRDSRQHIAVLPVRLDVCQEGS